MANHKLSLHPTSSSLRWDPPGSTTPPPQRPCSVPFLWEEIPGKPKEHVSLFKTFSGIPTDHTGPVSVRRLELPPRLVAKMQAMQQDADLNSPMTVLDGPGFAKPVATRVHVMCHSFSYYREAKKKAKRQRENWFWLKRKNAHSKKIGEELKIMTPTLSRNRSLNGASAPQRSSHFWVCFQFYYFHFILINYWGLFCFSFNFTALLSIR
jgi:Protein of unknown function (DUF688)